MGKQVASVVSGIDNGQKGGKRREIEKERRVIRSPPDINLNTETESWLSLPYNGRDRSNFSFFLIIIFLFIFFLILKKILYYYLSIFFYHFLFLLLCLFIHIVLLFLCRLHWRLLLLQPLGWASDSWVSDNVVLLIAIWHLLMFATFCCVKKSVLPSIFSKRTDNDSWSCILSVSKVWIGSCCFRIEIPSNV